MLRLRVGFARWGDGKAIGFDSVECKLESDGTPLIRNKHGAYVLDQQRIHQAQEALAASEPDSFDSTPSTETATASVNVARKAQSKASLDGVRAFLVKR